MEGGSMKQRTEHEILTKAAGGDAGAFGEIVRRYQYLVYAVALGIAKDPAAAQDIAQETFLSAFAALKDLRSERAFPSWLRAIARNTALAWKKEQGRSVPLENPDILPSDGGGPEDEAEREAERIEGDAFRAEIRRIVSSLSETLRFPVLLCYLDGVPTPEAARFLGIKEGTLRKRLHDGKRKLQERIVRMAEKSLQEYRLPRDFARRCICGCRRAQAARSRKATRRG
jgi:RNA polymerase sigma-70 factor, ECF subfamily